MGRSLIWIEDDRGKGWACSFCPWRYPVPTLLSDPEAKSAYDRLAAAKFGEHVCETRAAVGTQVSSPAEDNLFMERARILVRRGYKPKDAVELLLQELELEYRGDPKRLEKARADGDEFLRKVRKGLI